MSWKNAVKMTESDEGQVNYNLHQNLQMLHLEHYRSPAD